MNQNSEKLLQVSELGVRFGGVEALSKVSFDLVAGEVLAIVGPNGAGKSTLLNAISGLLRGNNISGDILLKGEKILGRPATRIAKLGFGRSFQAPPLLENESVLENILVGAHLTLDYRMGDQIWRRGRVQNRESKALKRAGEILDFVKLSGVANQKVGGLSYGTRKLVDISRALVSDPEILLLDEPTSGLDSAEQLSVANLLIDLHASTPISILVVEHHMDVVRKVASKAIGLHSGSVLVSGTPEEVLDSVIFRNAILGGMPPVSGNQSENPLLSSGEKN